LKRRDFLKAIGIGGVGTGAGFMFGKATKPPGASLIPYLVPPEDIIPGVGAWYSSLCTQCSAGCGTIVKVMEGRAKKIEGNPLHPVNKGKLCARGHASLQALYNPDRIKGPLKRSGQRGDENFVEISWDEGLSILSQKLSGLAKTGDADKLYMLSTPLRGHLNTLAKGFLNAYGSNNLLHYELFEEKNLRFANHLSMGLNSIPHYDIENTKYLLSFGADFSIHGPSPVNHSYGYGQMRQGQGGVRGKLVQVEPRMSLTGANADEWIPAKPGTEAVFALSLAHVVLEEGFYKGADAGSWKSLLEEFTPKNAAAITDVSEERIHHIAHEFASARPSLAIGGDNLSSYENGLSGHVAVNILNYLAGNIGIKGGVLPNPEETFNGPVKADFADRLTALTSAARASKVKMLIVHNTNPVFATPGDLKTAQALNKVPFIVSTSSFMDETTAMADLILPTHTSLEDWGDDFAEPSVGYGVSTLMQPAVTPVFNTKSLGDIMLSAASSLGGRVRDRLPWQTFGDFLKESWRNIHRNSKEMKAKAAGFDEFWGNLLKDGGWWESDRNVKSPATISAARVKPAVSEKPSQFEGNEKDFPYYLIVYPQAGHHDGRGANLPWLQELPDPMTSVVWGSWVEMNPKTAKGLGLKEGDMVAVKSPYGEIAAPLYLYPAIRPDTIGLPIGQGHKSYGRYAKNRGANPLGILPFKEDKRSGALALNSTRVSVSRSGKAGKLVKMEASTSEHGRGIIKTISPEEFKKLKKEVI